MEIEVVREEKDLDLYSASPDEQKDIDYALAFRDECAEQTKEDRRRWRRSLQRYNLALRLSDYEYIDDVPVGLTYYAVEKTAAALPGREFGFRARPTGEEDTKNALLFSEVLKQAWESPTAMDGPSKMQVVKRSMALFGHCPVQLYWETKTDKDGKVIKSDPSFIPLNVFNFYANKFYPDIQDCPEVGYISEVSLPTFRKMAEELEFKNADKVQGIVVGASSNINEDSDSSSTDSEELHSSDSSDKLRVVKIFEIQTDDEILTIALDEQPVWLRKEENKLGRKNCELFRLKRSPVPNRLYGSSDIERGGELEEQIQKMYNQMNFNTTLVDNPLFTFNKLDSNIDPRTFVTAPGAGIPRGSDPNSLTPIQFDSHLNESLAAISALLERWKRVVNVPDTLAGVGESSVDSATESSILDANTKAAFEDVVNEMKGTMHRIAVLLKEMYKKYGDESITVKVYTPELIEKLGYTKAQKGVQETIDKEDFILDRDIEIVVDFTTQNKSILSRRVIEFLQLTAQDQLVPPELKSFAYQQWLTLNDLEGLAMKFAELMTKQSSDKALADEENAKMANGQSLPPTPGATPAHTQRHVEYMRSNESGPEVDNLLKPHIEGEIAAAQNALAGGSPSQQPGQVQPENINQNNPVGV